MITLDAIVLPDDLWWEDETDWSPVQQSVEYSLTGSMIVEESTKQAGRPITLVGGDGRAWASRATVLALMAKAAVAGTAMVLTLHDNRSFDVLFRLGDGKPVDARPVGPSVGPYTTLTAADHYTLTLRLMEI